MSATNVAGSANQQILNFVQRPANRRLIPGTGAYSTPFRGSLFGLSDAVAVAQQLKRRRIDALWLGSNPCIPRSLANILAADPTTGDFPDFQRQMDSGLFSSRRWDGQEQPLPDWNPIQEPRGNWKVYADVLAQTFGSLDAVAMANCLPWGSRTTREFIATLDEREPALLKRVLRFADDLNAEIVTA